MNNIGSLYSKKVMEHFNHPRNVGEIVGASGVGTVGNKVCGDVMRLYIKVAKVPQVSQVPQVLQAKKYQEIIEDAKFQTLGCGAAIATSSMATEMIIGKPVSEALELTNKAIAEALDGLPPQKVHCSVLAAEAVKKAVEDYRSKVSKVSQVPQVSQAKGRQSSN